jgi:hypothetical protein
MSQIPTIVNDLGKITGFFAELINAHQLSNVIAQLISPRRSINLFYLFIIMY